MLVNMWMVRAGENAFLIDDFKNLGFVEIHIFIEVELICKYCKLYF